MTQRQSEIAPDRTGTDFELERRLLFPDLDLAARYDRAARNWHRRMRQFGYPQAYARLFARLQRAGWLQSLAHGGRVLDCGIGTGVASLALARAAQVHEVVGIDLSPGMLREAAANFAAAGMSARMRRADVHCLPLPDASFDACVSAHLLEQLTQPRHAVAEMARVLRRGAALVIVATRGRLADRFVRLKWPHALIARDRLIAWMRAAGMRPIADFALGDPWSASHWLSRVFVGVKA